MTENYEPSAEDLLGEAEAEEARARAINGRVVLPAPSNPMAVARILLADRYHQPTGALTLRHWRGSWMRWDGPAWAELEERTIRADLYHQVEHAAYWHETKQGAELRDWAPNRHKLTDLLDAFGAVSHLPQGTQPPAWLNPGHGATGIVACANGLLMWRRGPPSSTLRTTSTR